MRTTHLLPLLPLTSALAIPTPNWIRSLLPRQTACAATGSVHIISVRGSTEPPGEGDLQAVSDAIEASIAGSDSIGVVYPAELFPYEASEKEGVAALTKEMTDYTTRCPDSKLVLLGFSQGGQIIGDVLGGGSFDDTPPISRAIGDKVVAAVQFGDPANVAGKPYNIGTGNGGGIFERDDTTALDTYADVLQSWCDKGDIVCDIGLNVEAHTGEVERNGAAGAQFVINKIRGA